MGRLGYSLYVAQGGDVGAGVSDAMGRQAPEGLLGIHTNLLVPALNDVASLPAQTEQERAALAAIRTFQSTGNGYFVEQATRPQTIGYALLDSPVALAAWMLDHDTDGYYKIARAFVDGQPSGQPHPRLQVWRLASRRPRASRPGPRWTGSSATAPPTRSTWWSTRPRSRFTAASGLR